LEFEAFMDIASAEAAVRKNEGKKGAGRNKANSKKMFCKETTRD
jgi:hypothetical protein